MLGYCIIISEWECPRWIAGDVKNSYGYWKPNSSTKNSNSSLLCVWWCGKKEPFGSRKEERVVGERVRVMMMGEYWNKLLGGGEGR